MKHFLLLIFLCSFTQATEIDHNKILREGKTTEGLKELSKIKTLNSTQKLQKGIFKVVNSIEVFSGDLYSYDFKTLGAFFFGKGKEEVTYKKLRMSLLEFKKGLKQAEAILCRMHR